MLTADSHFHEQFQWNRQNGGSGGGGGGGGVATRETGRACLVDDGLETGSERVLTSSSLYQETGLGEREDDSPQGKLHSAATPEEAEL
ncbi:hypothetical protein CRUP_018983 [Coryphaenoides rupestris]|nr:hypothetical protein CRUP_018983 [Coryphaenoides rupestris]